jgi:Flp pilus assembly protein TadG
MRLTRPSNPSRACRFRRDEAGAVALIFSLSLLPVIMAVGVGVDYSRASAARAQLQRAVDAAVLAGVPASEDKRQAIAGKVFDQNKPGRGVVSTAAFATDAEGRFTGTAEANVAAAMLSILGRTNLQVGALATAAAQPAGPPAEPCILALDPNGPQALLVNSGAVVRAPACAVHVKSNRDPAVIMNAGSTLDVAGLCSKGQILFNTTARPPYQENCNGHHDPYAGKLNHPARGQPCTYSNKSDWNDAPLTVGSATGVTVWCGWNNFNFARPITFSPGIHIIREGAVTVASGASVIARGVTFYFEDDSRLQMNGDAALTLEARTTGPTAGVAMFEKQGLRESQLVFNGLNGQSLRRIFYLPGREVTFNSASSATSDRISLVVNRLIVNSNTWTIQPHTGAGASAQAMPVR